MASKLNLTRSEIAQIVGNDQKKIKQFERLFQVATDVENSNLDDIETFVPQQLNPINPVGVFDYIDMATLFQSIGKPGRLFWDDTNGTLAVTLKGGNVTLQVGQELNQPVKRHGGGTLSDGQVMYSLGSDGINLTVAPAQANATATCEGTIGLMTESALAGQAAFMTTFGLVRNIDTSALTEGAEVFLSPSVAGGMTATKPTFPDRVVSVGWCIRSNVNNGAVFVNINVESEYPHSPVTVKAIDYTASDSDRIIKVTAVGVVITLSTAVGKIGHEYVINNASGGWIRVNTTSSQTINGDLEKILNKNSSMTVYSDGTNWRIM